MSLNKRPEKSAGLPRVSRKPSINMKPRHGPVAEEAAELDSRLQDAADFSIPATITEQDGAFGGADGVAKSNRFPVKLTQRDPYDSLASIKKKLVNDKGAVPGMGQAVLTTEDLEHLERKRQALQYEDMYRFLDNYFDTKDPAIANWVAGMMPEYFDRREAVIDQQAELQKRVAKLRLRGPQDRQDLITIYLMNSGALKLPKGPLHMPDQWHDGGENAFKDGFKQGLFNPKRLFAGRLALQSQRHDAISPGTESLDSLLRSSYGPLTAGGGQRSGRVAERLQQDIF